MPNDVTLDLGNDYVGSAYSPQVEITETATGHEIAITHASPDAAGQLVTDEFFVPNYSGEEADREAAEAARAAAEAQRAAAESEREAHEDARQSVESERASAESARDAAETERASAESARAAAESARATSEQGRASAESARVSAEQIRAAAETARESASATAVHNAEVATAAANAAADRVDAAIEDAEDAADAAEDAAASATSAAGSATSAAGAANTAATAANAAAQTANTAAAAADTAREGIQADLAAKADKTGTYSTLIAGGTTPDSVTDGMLVQTGGVLEHVGSLANIEQRDMLEDVTFVQGSINAATGDELISTTRIRCGYISLDGIERFTVSVDSGYRFVIDWFDSNKSPLVGYHGNHGLWQTSEITCYASEYKSASYVRFLVSASSDGDITTSESLNLHATYGGRLVSTAILADAGIVRNLSSYSWSIGNIADGADVSNTSMVRSEKVPMGKGSIVTVEASTSPYKLIRAYYYDAVTGKYLGKNGDFTANGIVVPYDCDVRVVAVDSNATVISSSQIEEYASAVTACVLPVIENDEIQRLATNAIFTTDSAYFEPIGNNGGVWVKLNSMWVRGSLYSTTTWANVLPASHATSPAGVADCLLIPHNSSLVYDSKTTSFAIVLSDSIETFAQVPIFSVGTAIDMESVIGGIGYHLYVKWLQAQGNETYKALAYATLLNAAEETEQFIYFTDPHLMGSDNDTVSFLTTFNRYIDTVDAYAESTPTTFVMCGGDWLNSGDSPSVAKWKLGLIYGKCKQLGKYYGLVGNHDTNYQGTDAIGTANAGTLDNQTIANAMFGGEHANYYQFDGTHTRFYVFDSGTDWDNSMTSYRWEQVAWFANALLTDNKAHSAVSIHIWYTNYQDPTADTISVLATNIASVIAAYNARTSVTLNGSTYDFSSCTGHVEFVICGHTHFDKSGTSGNIPVVNTLNTQSGNTPSFDLMYVDYDNRAISTVRIGTGSDRTFQLATF